MYDSKAIVTKKTVNFVTFHFLLKQQEKNIFWFKKGMLNLPMMMCF
jgi:hypothetical protein